MPSGKSMGSPCCDAGKMTLCGTPSCRISKEQNRIKAGWKDRFAWEHLSVFHVIYLYNLFFYQAKTHRFSHRLTCFFLSMYNH